MAENNKDIQAPWRAEYIKSLGSEEKGGCFLCDYWNHPDSDAEHFVVWRTDAIMVLMNRYPYTNGHLLVAPSAHTGDLEQLPDDALASFAAATRDAVRLIAHTIGPHGYNIGMNIGRCAGAGVPDHLHNHVVPRWNGDTNFMTIVGDTRIIPEDLGDLYRRLADDAVQLGISQSGIQE